MGCQMGSQEKRSKRMLVPETSKRLECLRDLLTGRKMLIVTLFGVST